MVGVVVIATGKVAGKTPTQREVVTQAGLLITIMGEMSQVPRAVSRLGQVAGFTHRVGHMMESLRDVVVMCVVAQVTAAV